MKKLLRNEGYVPYGDEQDQQNERNESKSTLEDCLYPTRIKKCRSKFELMLSALVTRQTYESDAEIDEERTVWIERGTIFNISEEHRVTILGRQHEIQGLKGKTRI